MTDDTTICVHLTPERVTIAAVTPERTTLAIATRDGALLVLSVPRVRVADATPRERETLTRVLELDGRAA